MSDFAHPRKKFVGGRKNREKLQGKSKNTMSELQGKTPCIEN
jgi:hypothetical protein